MLLPSLIGDRLPSRRILLAHVLHLQLEETILWVDWEVALVDRLHLPQFEYTFFELLLNDIHSLEDSVAQASWIDSGVGAGTPPDELDVAVSSAAPVLKNFCESRVVRQDRGGLIGRGGAEMVTRLESIHALMEGSLEDMTTVGHLHYLVYVPST